MIGRGGELAAILFGDPLTAPGRRTAEQDPGWPAHAAAGPLRLVADGGGRLAARRVVEDGPGPSGVDLPAGCWRIRARGRAAPTSWNTVREGLTARRGTGEDCTIDVVVCP